MASLRNNPRYSGVSTLEITAADAGRRLDNCLFAHLKGVPKSHIYRIIRSGQVRVNGGRAKPSRRVASSDIVRVPPVRLATPASALRRVSRCEERRFERSVIFEDEHFLVLDKPEGVVVHGGSRHNFGLVEVSRRLRRPREGGRFPALTHRLDRDTSGCLLMAKSRVALLEVQRAFRLRKVAKEYIALVLGVWEPGAVRVRQPLAVTAAVAGPKVVVDEDAGRPATTDFEVAERLDDCTLLNVRPLTGRMHQIRVHAAQCGHPVAGDCRYGDFAANRALERVGLRRLFLHASRLAFECLGREYDFASPLPEKLLPVLEALRQCGSLKATSSRRGATSR